MERIAWTDERLDERMAAIDNTFERIFGEFDRVHAEIAALRGDLNRFQDRMVQVGFGLVTVLIAAIVTIVLALA